MTSHLCLTCDNYKFLNTPFIDGKINHPIMKWECIKGLTPYVADDSDYCIDYKARGKATV